MLIRNARINTHDNQYDVKDLYIRDGKIERIEDKIDLEEILRKNISESKEVIKKLEIIDLKGEQYLIPGVIDPHVHLRDPGLNHKEDLHTGSMACAKGGITTFIDMPNTVPTTTNLEALINKKKIASRKSIVNYGFHFGGTSTDNSERIPSEGIASTKVFMNISTGKMLVEKDEVLANIFSKSKIVAVHAEAEMVEKAITHNNKYGNKLYLCHISSKKEIETIVKYRENKKEEDKEFFVEVTPHHLFLTENNLVEDGNKDKLLRMKPELKTNLDVEALWDAIDKGIIDTIGTDHAPHLLEEKLARTTFGIPGVENSLPLMLNAVVDGKLTLEKLTNLMSKKTSEIFKIKNRGKIQEGFYADLVVVDLEKEFIIKNEDVLSKCGWTPFDGYKGKGTIETTIVNGNIVYKNNKIINNIGSEIEYE